MAAISTNTYVDVLDDIVHKYNKTVHKTIKLIELFNYETS